MALQTATNPDTGERFALIDNEWVPFSKTASNPDTGEKFGLIKNEWMPLTAKAAAPPKDGRSAVDQIPGQTVKAPEARPQDQSVLRQAADVPLKIGAGAVTGVRLIADAFGADSGVSKNLRSVEDEIAALYSAQSKKDSREIARIMKEAEDKGILDQMAAGIKAMSVAPVDVISNSLGTAAPAILAGLATVFTGGAPLVATGLTLGTGAIMGAGTAKSAIYDATKQVLAEKTKMTPDQIEAAAVKAQEYGGKNLDQILLASAIGAVGARTGVEPVIARQLAKDIIGRTTAEQAAATVATQTTGREAAKAAVKEVTARETALAAERGVVKQGAITAGKEFATESVQGGQEQMAQNIALQREGFDVPTMRGVVSQGTMEGLAGFGMGAAAGAREGYTAKREAATDQSAGRDYKDLFTTASDDIKAGAPQATQEQLDLINAATSSGTTPPATTPPATTPPAATDALAKAQAYIDEGKPNTFKAKNLVKELGLDVPAGEGFNARAIEAIKAHLGQGAPTQSVPAVTPPASVKPQLPVAQEGEPAMQVQDGTRQPVPMSALTTPEALQRAGEVLSVPDRTPERILYELNFANSRGGLATWEIETILGLRNQEQTSRRGAPSGTDNAPSGTGAGVDAAANITANAPRASVNQPGSVGGAGAAVPTGDTGAKIELTSLSQETQDEISKRRDEVLNLIEDGAAGKLIKNKLNYLNRLEEQHGVEVFKPSNDGLPAKRSPYVSTQRLIDQGKGATATAPDGAPVAPKGTSVEAAMRLADKYEKQAEAERVRLLEESRGESLPNIKVNDIIVEEYNATRDAVNQAADEHNNARAPLVENLKQLYATRKEAEAKLDNEDLNDPANEAFLKELDEQIKVAEKDLQAYGGTKNKLPNWDKEITPVEKEVYLDNIRNNTVEEHNAAAKALLEFRRQQGVESREGEGTLNRNDQRLIKGYEDNREITGKVYGFKFPAWRDLSNAAKAIYLRTVANNSGLQQDVGFAEVAQQIISENGDISSKDKQAQNKNIQKIKDEVRQKSEKLQEYYQKLRDAQSRTSGEMPKASEQLPNNLVQLAKDNNLKGLLDGIAEKLKNADVTHRKIYQQIAKLVANLGLKTQIKFVDSLPDGDLAIYKADKDTIYVTPEGLTYTTILHEVVHAASVRVMNLFLTGKKNLLTQYQIKAVEQILAIMKSTKGALESRHPNAYDNPYEFLAYSLTDKIFQVDLQGEGVEYAQDVAFGLRKDKILDRMPGKKSMWSEFKKAIAGIVGYKPGQMVSNNFMMELNSAFEDILSVPTEPIYLTDLPAKAPKAPKAPKGKGSQRLPRVGGMEDPKNREAYKLSEKEYPGSKLVKAVKDLFKVQGWRDKATAFVDTTYEIGSFERRADLGGKIIRDMSGSFNNIAEHMTLATGEKLQFLTHHIDEPLTNLKKAFGDWMKVADKSFDDALIDFHMFAEMFHEPERRTALWVQAVPLNTTKNLVQNGKPISAAERRTQILGDPSKGIPGLKDQVELTAAQQKQLWSELTSLAENYADVAGYTPRDIKIDPTKPNSAQALKKENALYNVLGIDQKEVDLRKTQFDALPQEQQDAIMKIFDSTRDLAKATKELNKIGNYWSYPVSNITGMYDYQFYMPFKGVSKHTAMADLLDPDTIGQGRIGTGKGSRGKALQEIEHTTHGRFAVSDNPLLQLMSDAYKGADRAGRRNFSQSIKNALPKSAKNPNGTGIIDGEIVEHIPFTARETVDLSKYKGGANIFHYNEDGSIDILRINNPKLLNAVRYSFKEEKPLWDLANDVTGWIGAQHTRYNINFAPKNFVVDMFTNAWNMGGGKMGPLSAPKYIGLMAARVLQNGLGKAWEVALLNEKGDKQSQQLMINSAKKDPFVRDMLEMIKFGGKTAYIESFSIKNNTEKLRKLKNKNWVAGTKESIDAFLDTWSGMFELTSRTAAYSIFKEYYYKQQIKNGVSDDKGPNGEMSPAERAACTQAAAETKNLTNFEKVGTYGRELGALYMFIRPSAISAARAIETASPAFTPVSWAEENMPAVVRADPKAEAEYIKNFKKLRTNAQIMVVGLTGAGYVAYLMAMMMAPDDEWKRNSVRNDNMQQWTRNARFHIPDSVGLGRDVVIQIPWGFGLGAFPSIGAQIGGMVHGQTSFKDGMGNILGSILTDSFLPIPISKISPSEDFGRWAYDSVVPSMLRPISEYFMNMNGIGQAINSTTQRKFGDAFTGGDRIPEVYKDFAAWLYDKTKGKRDISPNTMYFLTNSYVDGIARLGEMAYNWIDLSKGDKKFNPKTDLALLGSFFGAKSNVDAREFTKVQEKVKDLETRLKTLNKTNRATALELRAENPGIENAISVYNQQVARLDKIRKRANEIRTMDIPPIDKEEFLRLNILQQNMLKHEMIERLKGYNIEP